MVNNPFDLTDDAAYHRWRDDKLKSIPHNFADLIVEVRDPCSLTQNERLALIDCCKIANMAIYSGPDLGEERNIPRLLGKQLGLIRLDHNPGADEDDITSIQVMIGDKIRSDFIPYTNRALHWHTDGYYNTLERQIRGMILHCVRPAKEGGINSFIDHELVYIQLRDENPAYIAALLSPDAMTIPPHIQYGNEIRPISQGPVFSIMNDGSLHMRYTARSRNIIWRDDTIILKGRAEETLVSDTKTAITALQRILINNIYALQGTLNAGQGIVCNNILHDRSSFIDDPSYPRLIYRARYYDRISS